MGPTNDKSVFESVVDRGQMSALRLTELLTGVEVHPLLLDKIASATVKAINGL